MLDWETVTNAVKLVNKYEPPLIAYCPIKMDEETITFLVEKLKVILK